MCIGKKPRLKPMNMVQKFHRPSLSSSIRPVILGNQKYTAPTTGNTLMPIST